MLDISRIDDKSVEQILTKIDEKSEITFSLPGQGLLHIEKELPYLVIYRRKDNDPGTERMVISEASFLIIGKEDFPGYQDLVFRLADKLSSAFKSYMLFEIYSGKPESNCFVIKAPSGKLPTTLDVLKTELEKVNTNYSGLYLYTEVRNTKSRQPEGEEELMSVAKAKESGALVVGFEIPPVYRSPKGKLYPVFFRNFKDFIVAAIHKTIFDFVRVQTSIGVSSSHAFGRTILKDKVFEIDKKLTEIEKSFQFLWLISPSNIHEIKHSFFESNYEKLLDYHYRLLPIDPDILKRKLYNLKMEDIDDPAMSYIFREKREELNEQITMLSERGTKNFFYTGIRLYKGVESVLCTQARDILEIVDETTEKPVDLIDSKGFSSLARKEFDYFRQQDENFKCKVHIRKDVNIMMVSQGELYIPEDYSMSRKESAALIQHEVGTHVLTYHNGSRQPLSQLSIGLADYDPLQEGLAVLSEYLVGGLTPNRLRTLAGRVIAGEALMNGAEFREIFNLLYKYYGFMPHRAFNITSRIMQGGGFLKDIIYLKGLVELQGYLKNGGEYEPLLAGKFGIKHTGIVKELTERKILNTGVLRPSYLLTEDITEKLKLIREGLPLSQMINK